MKNRKSLIIIALTVFLIATISAVSLMVSAAGANDFNLAFNLNSKYKYGDTVEIPTATYNGQKMDFTVSMPNGLSTNRSSIKLNQSGVYTVTYLAKKSGSNEYFKKVISFTVLGQLFSVRGGGYIDYVQINDKVSGLYANLQKGDVLVYNGIIDVNEFADNQMLFKMAVMASTPGEEDISQFEIKLTDIYDESKFLTYRFKKHGGVYGSSVSYVDCGFGSTFCGLENSGIGSLIYEINGEEVKYYPHINSEKYGQATQVSMTGGTKSEPFNGNRMFGLTLDESTGLTYVLLNDYGESRTYYPRLISNLYDENTYGGRFEGFTDGKVKLSIEATKYVKSECGFFIAEIGGIGVSQDNWNQFDSQVKPIINVNLGEYTLDNVPASRKGSTYKLFAAQAYDVIDGELDYEAKVYYGYSNSNRIRINVADGAFKTDYIGKYTIEYSTTNASGNRSVVLVNVDCVQVDGELSLNLIDEYDYSKPAKAGDCVKLFNDFEIANYLGNPALKVECVNKSRNVVYTIDENNSFSPYYAGDYIIRYTYSDFSQSKSVEKSLKVNSNSAVFYEQTANLPQFLIKGGRYDLGFVKAYSLASGEPVEVPVKTFVKNDGSSQNKAVESDYIVEAENKVAIVFKADVTFDVQELTIERSVVDIGLGGNLDKSKLFIPTTDGISFAGASNSINCLFDGSVQNATFTFANVLARNTFKLIFAPFIEESAFSPFEKFNLYLADAENTDNKVIVSFFAQNGGWYVTVNNKTLKVAESWGAAEDSFILSYNIFEGKLSVGSSVFTVSEYANGSKKATFDNGVILSGEFINVGSCKGISLLELNNQILSNNKNDYIQPVLDTTRSDCSGEMEFGSIVTVGDFFSADVITPYSECTYSVKGIDGNFITSTEGKLLREVDGAEVYTFKLEAYGNYQVIITTKDQNGNMFSLPYKILVINYTSPIIRLSDKVTSGETCKWVNFAKFTVENDKGGHNAFITVLDPKGTMTYYSEETKFAPRMPGKYIVTISVIDVVGNIAEESYVVTVK